MNKALQIYDKKVANAEGANVDQLLAARLLECLTQGLEVCD